MALLFSVNQGFGGLKCFIRKDVLVGTEYFMIIHYVINGKRQLQSNEKQDLVCAENNTHVSFLGHLFPRVEIDIQSRFTSGLGSGEKRVFGKTSLCRLVCSL